MIVKQARSVFHKLLYNPRIFNLFIKYFGDQATIRKVIEDEIAVSNNNKILDLGCGTGSFSDAFPPDNYIGVDIEADYMSFARTGSGRPFLVMDAASLGFKDDYFDLIFANGLLHHLNDNKTAEALEEIKRVLKPSGKVVLIDFSYDKDKDNFKKKLMRKLDRGSYVREIDDLTGMVKSHLVIEKSYPISCFMDTENYVFVLSRLSQKG